MKKSTTILALTASVFFAGEALSQGDLFVFPNEGQSNEQMEQDKAECHYTAGQQTGYGMGAPTTVETTDSGGEVVRGAAKGAAAGAAIGAISGNAGKGAKWGAVGGSVLGGRKKRKAQKEQDQAVAMAAQQEAATYDNYKRVMTACLNARGYSVQ